MLIYHRGLMNTNAGQSYSIIQGAKGEYDTNTLQATTTDIYIFIGIKLEYNEIFQGPVYKRGPIMLHGYEMYKKRL